MDAVKMFLTGTNIGKAGSQIQNVHSYVLSCMREEHLNIAHSMRLIDGRDYVQHLRKLMRRWR